MSGRLVPRGADHALLTAGSYADRQQGESARMAQPTRIIVLQRPDQPLASVCARLQDWGSELVACGSYDQAAAALSAEGADIVLIDAWIEDGMPLFTQIKAHAATRFLPVVIATAEEPGAVAAHALALGADDVLALPIRDAELQARARALARLAGMERERRRRDALLAQFGVPLSADSPAVPAIERIGILLIGPAGGDQIQVLTALGGAATAAYAETADSAVERLRRDDLDVALITTSQDHRELQRLCATIRSDPELFDMPVLLIGRAQHFTDPDQPFAWGLSEVLFQPFHPEVLRLRVQCWVRQQRLRRHLRSGLVRLAPTTDRLTRLYGHGFLHAYVDHLIEHGASTPGTLAVVGLAVTQMGHINQAHGYAAGDRVLAAIGGVLARTSRAEDLPARLDGDRFCLVINQATAREAGAAAERIGALMSHTPVVLESGRPVQVTLKAGVAELAEGDDAAALIGRAFARMAAFGLRQAS
jgi:two-component system, cell cycle response regulator